MSYIVIFRKRVVPYSEAMSDLIAKGILASPEFIRRETGENFEPVISIDEEKLIRRYGELPETLVNKIALSNVRNELIINEYLNHKDQYGKTLIFALNILHCRFLYEELKRRGVKCDYIYSGLEGNSATINAFKNGEIDVFREEEHKYPNWTEWEHFLADNMNKFDIREW